MSKSKVLFLVALLTLAAFPTAFATTSTKITSSSLQTSTFQGDVGNFTAIVGVTADLTGHLAAPTGYVPSLTSNVSITAGTGTFTGAVTTGDPKGGYDFLVYHDVLSNCVARSAAGMLAYNGTNDTACLQTAISGGPAYGEYVRLACGQFNLQWTLTLRTLSHLEGCGMAALNTTMGNTQLPGAPTNIGPHAMTTLYALPNFNGGAGGFLLASPTTNTMVELNEFRINGGNSSQPNGLSGISINGSNTYVHHLWIEDFQGDGIDIGPVTNDVGGSYTGSPFDTVRDNEFSNVYRYGIYIAGGDGHLIQDNVINGGFGTGSATNPAACQAEAGIVTLNNNNIVGNYINCWQTGILVLDDNVKIASNTIDSTQRDIVTMGHKAQIVANTFEHPSQFSDGVYDVVSINSAVNPYSRFVRLSTTGFSIFQPGDTLRIGAGAGYENVTVRSVVGNSKDLVLTTIPSLTHVQFSIVGDVTRATTLAAPVASSDTSIVVVDATNFTNPGRIIVGGDSSANGATIASISGNTITLTGPIGGTFTAGDVVLPGGLTREDPLETHVVDNICFINENTNAWPRYIVGEIAAKTRDNIVVANACLDRNTNVLGARSGFVLRVANDNLTLVANAGVPDIMPNVGNMIVTGNMSVRSGFNYTGSKSPVDWALANLTNARFPILEIGNNGTGLDPLIVSSSSFQRADFVGDEFRPKVDGATALGDRLGHTWSSVVANNFALYGTGSPSFASVFITPHQLAFGAGGNSTDTDTCIARGAANRFDVCAGDSFRITSDAPGSQWNGGLVIFGNQYMWFDSTNTLRVKNGVAPTSDTDGTTIGSIFYANSAVTQGATSGTYTLSTALASTSYAVACETNWGTTHWVTAKSTTQFTVNFGTAAPASATVDCQISRP